MCVKNGVKSLPDLWRVRLDAYALGILPNTANSSVTIVLLGSPNAFRLAFLLSVRIVREGIRGFGVLLRRLAVEYIFLLKNKPTRK